MNTDTNRKTEKEAYKYLRGQVCGNAWKGGDKQRYLLLAYAFVRGIPYIALERTINEDKFLEEGRKTFYSRLAYCVAKHVMLAYGLEPKSIYSSEEYQAVHNWLTEKFAKAQEAA